jgi:hypothetical protein
MQIKNTIQIMLHSKGMKLMKKVNLRFIGLLIFISLFQHFSFATLPITPGLSKSISGTIQNSHFEKTSVKHDQSQIDLFVEFEEDDLQNEQVYLRASLSSNCHFNSNHYSVLTNTLYLRLAFANHSKVVLPFFVLHHSWKSDLS